MITKREFSDSEKERAKKNTFVLIGITGKGKSQIIKYLTGDSKAKVSNSKSSCTPYSSLYYGAIQSDANKEELFCLIDTAGLCDSSGSEQDRKNYNDIRNILIDYKCEIKGIFIVENFQDERLDGEERKVFKAASDLFPLKKFWNHISIIFTHYYNKGSTSKVQIKKEQIGPFCDSLRDIMKQVKERIKTIDEINVESINKIYVNIDNNVIEKKGFNLDDEEEKELYEQGLKDLEKAKKELYKEILEKIKLEPLYDKVKDNGTQRIIIKKSVSALTYHIFEAYIEKRSFYLKGKLIFIDYISIADPEFKESINKGLFYLEKFGKGVMLVDMALVSPIVKGVDIIINKENSYFEIGPALTRIYEEWFPDETDKEYRKKLY